MLFPYGFKQTSVFLAKFEVEDAYVLADATRIVLFGMAEMA